MRPLTQFFNVKSSSINLTPHNRYTNSRKDTVTGHWAEAEGSVILYWLAEWAVCDVT